MLRDGKGWNLLTSADDYVCVDLETTGLDPTSCQIIEIGAVKMESGVEVSRFSQLINPGEPIDPFITKLTGITNDMLRGQPEIEEILPKFLDWVGDSLIVGHNVNFDVNFLYDNTERTAGHPFSNDFVDTMRLSRKLYPEERHHRLVDLIRRFGIADSEEHRALSDALQTARCYEYIKQIVEAKGIVFDNEERRHGSGHAPLFRGTSELIRIAPRDMAPDPNFSDQVFVFTGTLKKMLRKDAQQAVLNLGGIIGNSVTKKTNFLVIGTTEYCGSLKGDKSSKWLKAEKLQLEGNDLSIISEDVFYEMLGDSIELMVTDQ